MGALGRATNIRPKHDPVGRIPAKGLGVEGIPTGQEFDVGSSAVDLLLVLDGVLDDDFLFGVAVVGFGEGGGDAVESGVGSGLDSFVGWVRVPFAGCVDPGSEFGGGFPVGGDGPAVLPAL